MSAESARFLESLRVRRYSPATIASRADSLKHFFRYLDSVGLADVREVSRETVRAYQAELLRQFKVTTVHVHLSAVRRFCEHLEATDAILINPCEGLLLPRLTDRLPRHVLTPEEAKRLLAAPDTATAQGRRDKAILELFYSTGLRLEEMTRLTVHDVDAVHGFCRVTLGKGARERIVPVGRKACECVSEYLKSVRNQWSQPVLDERALWLSVRTPHRAISKQMLAKLVRAYAKAAGIEKPVGPHVWRHTCATHLVANGSNIAYVQRLLGHRSLRTTQVYTRVAVADIKATHARAHPRNRA